MLLFGLFFVVFSQDPAEGWLGYAVGNCPDGTKVTHMEAKWKVGAAPNPSDAFYSPWFGIDTTDNLNLLQPVNPWLGDSWAMYTEYYQWEPSDNQDSDQYEVNPGDQLFGQVTYLGDAQQTYRLNQTDLTTGQSSTMDIKVQQDDSGVYKNFTVLYVVYEKVADCGDYPPDGIVTFTDIKVFCSGKQITPQWKTAYVEDVCNNRATVIDPATIKITWDTSKKKIELPNYLK